MERQRLSDGIYDRSCLEMCIRDSDYRGGSLLGATQEMVDAYFMANGMSPVTGYAADGVTPIINEASGYKEDGTSSSDYKSADGTLYAPAGTRNMYAVSYTHLDVYKRQVWCWLKGVCRLRRHKPQKLF